jgi:hypothetical protein
MYASRKEASPAAKTAGLPCETAQTTQLRNALVSFTDGDLTRNAVDSAAMIRTPLFALL